MEPTNLGTNSDIHASSDDHGFASTSLSGSSQQQSALLKPDRRIMSICTAASRCGCSLYIEPTLYLVADRKDPGDPYKGMEIIIQRGHPEIVIVSRAQKQLISFLEKRFHFKIMDLSRGGTSYDDVLDSFFTLVIVPNCWFAISQGEQKLIESDWMTVRGIKDLQERSLVVFSKIKKSVDVCAIRSIAAIEKFLVYEFTRVDSRDGQAATQSIVAEASMQRHYIQSQGSQATRVTSDEARVPEDLMPVLDVRYMDPGPALSIDINTLVSLNIFPHDRSNRYQSVPDSDLSPRGCLYDILNMCQSSQGKKTLNTVMMWPLIELDELQHRHQAVDYFLRPENKLFRDQLAIQLKNIVPLANILTKMVQTVCGYKELSIMYKSLWAFMTIIDLINANDEHQIDILSRIATLDSPGFRETVNSIMNVVDFEASRRDRRVQICDAVSDEVDAKRDVAKNLAAFCDAVAIEETAKYKDTLRKPCKVIYVPRVGFLESVELNSSVDVANMRLNKEFDVMIVTEQHIYFKTPRMDALDRDAGDITCDLIDLQEKVVVSLQNEILRHSDKILGLMELCGQLDCLLSFALVSAANGFTKPVFNTANDDIDIRDAMNPLQCGKQAIVPNNIRFYREDTEKRARIMIITGPNSCGKTTYMRTACLVIYMAHIGCFVPATYARLPIVDAILTRMQSLNSISTGLSTFATDLNQINYALARATSRSFIAIDEFGKGTQAHDGFHLLKGLAAFLARLGDACPHVMIATHFNRLIDHLQAYSEFVLYKTFRVTRDLSKDSIIYEFKIMDGLSESSLADQVAINAGVPQCIIQRARQIRELIIQGRQIQPRPSYAA